MTDPLAGYMPPGDRPEGGMGLWLARQLCDRVEVLATDDPTVVRMTMQLR
jgi:anti-sigma regulatory factor (Ser/Thr protein kinase)